MPRGDLLDPRLEQRRLVRRPQSAVVLDGGLVDARSGLSVKSFELDVKSPHRVDDGVGEIGKDAGAEHAVPEHAGRERNHVAVVLLPDRVRVFFEQKEFVLGGHLRAETHGLGLRDHPLEYLAGRHGEGVSGAVVKVEDEESRSRLPRDDAKGGKVDPGQRVRIAGVPAGDSHVVVERVGRVPAEDHIAEPEPGLGGGIKLVAADVFPAQDAVDVEPANFDFGDAVFAEEGLDCF